MKRGGEGERGRGRNRRGPGACRHGGVAASGMHEGPKHHKPSWAAWVQGAGSKREEASPGGHCTASRAAAGSSFSAKTEMRP